MKKFKVVFCLCLSVAFLSNINIDNANINGEYQNLYKEKIATFQLSQSSLSETIQSFKSIGESEKENLKKGIAQTRTRFKAIDIWLRYLQPTIHKKINGPLLVEWETEVFEKFEKPYKRIGAGLSLAEQYLDEKDISKDSLLFLLNESSNAIKVFQSDSITSILNKPDHFFFANRLFLLNLAAIYTTGFECPNTENIIPELKQMLKDVSTIYTSFNQTFNNNNFSKEYLQQYNSMKKFVEQQSNSFEEFNHFEFIKNYVNPLYSLNQQEIQRHHAVSKSFNDYTLNNRGNSIFTKDIYKAQNSKGIYIAVTDTNSLNELKQIGKLFFYDPILSGNGMRSCASCHNPQTYFNDTVATTSLQIDRKSKLERNTPTLINAIHNHLLMLDGKHLSLESQAVNVLTNPLEMNNTEKGVIDNVLSCDVYKKSFKKFLALTPNYPTLTLDHIVSAIVIYYTSFSNALSPFDEAINNGTPLQANAVEGFNLFMSKAQCATCHFVPLFNGVKPPYVSSEFEVLGVPEDLQHKSISKDVGRYGINPAVETMNAFRTGSIRNSTYTKPYMHNGIFKTMDEVIDFYDAGGGVGRGLNIGNQTLSSDSIHLSSNEKEALKFFIKTLDENIVLQAPPPSLPASKLKQFANRKVGGEY